MKYKCTTGGNSGNFVAQEKCILVDFLNRFWALRRTWRSKADPRIFGLFMFALCHKSFLNIPPDYSYGYPFYRFMTVGAVFQHSESIILCF